MMLTGIGEGNASTSVFLVMPTFLETDKTPIDKIKRCAPALCLVVLGHLLHNKMACQSDTSK